MSIDTLDQPLAGEIHAGQQVSSRKGADDVTRDYGNDDGEHFVENHSL